MDFGERSHGNFRQMSLPTDHPGRGVMYGLNPQSQPGYLKSSRDYMRDYPANAEDYDTERFVDDDRSPYRSYSEGDRFPQNKDDTNLFSYGKYNSPHITPVTMQPMGLKRQHTTHVVKQHQPLRNWSTGLFDCWDDMCTCVSVAFCPECFSYHVVSKAGENPCLPCVLPCWLIALRSYIRGKHNISGSICGDAWSVWCCYQCAICQLSRELDNMNTGLAPL